MIRALTKSLLKPRYYFSALKKQQTNEELEDITLAFFYRRLLRNTKVKPNGNSKFNPYDLHYMARLTQSPQESDLLLQAYYNFLGHHTKITQKTSDLIVKKYLEVNPNPQKILQLYKKHYLIRYFPHYDTTYKFLQNVSTSEDNLKKLLTIIYSSPFIKIDKKFFEKAMQTMQQLGLKKEMRSLYKYAAKKLPEVIESPEILKYIGKIPSLPTNQYINSVINGLKGSKQSEDICKLAQIYLGTGKNLQDVFQELSKLSSLDRDEMKLILELIYNKCLNIYKKKPALYKQVIESYKSLIQVKPKNKKLQSIQQNILDIPNQNPQQEANQQENNEVQEDSPSVNKK